MILRLHLALIAALLLVGCGSHMPTPPVPPSPTILPSATVGQAYLYTLGPAPAVFSASGVPNGLQVARAGTNLVVIGTPKQPGTFSFTVNDTAASLNVKGAK